MQLEKVSASFSRAMLVDPQRCGDYRAVSFEGVSRKRTLLGVEGAAVGPIFTCHQTPRCPRVPTPSLLDLRLVRLLEPLRNSWRLLVLRMVPYGRDHSPTNQYAFRSCDFAMRPDSAWHLGRGTLMSRAKHRDPRP